MDRVLSILQQKLRDHPESKSLQAAVSHLSQVKTRDSHTITWDVVKRDFNSLVAEGLWEEGVEGEQLLQDIRKILMNQTRSQSRSSSVARAARSPTRSPDGTEHDSLVRKPDVSIVMPPPVSTSLLPASSVDPTILPVELVEVLNHTIFLHHLAIDPESVLPPGKSLLSVMLRPHAQDRQPGEHPSLRDRVEDLFHKAFWDEVHNHCMYYKNVYPNPAYSGTRETVGPYTSRPAASSQATIRGSAHSTTASSSCKSSTTHRPVLSPIAHLLASSLRYHSPPRDTHMSTRAMRTRTRCTNRKVNPPYRRPVVHRSRRGHGEAGRRHDSIHPPAVRSDEGRPIPVRSRHNG